MPIRFRCAYCSQLMGIAKRKAGTVVSCPKCHGQVVVPHPPPNSVDDDPPASEPSPQPLFEGADFERMFGSVPGEVAAPREMAPAILAPEPARAPAGPPPFQQTGASEEIHFEVEGFESAPPVSTPGPGSGRSGVWLSPTAVVLLCLLMVVLLALAFVGGLLLGRTLVR